MIQLVDKSVVATVLLCALILPSILIVIYMSVNWAAQSLTQQKLCMTELVLYNCDKCLVITIGGGSFYEVRGLATHACLAKASLAWPDRFFPFFFGVAEKGSGPVHRPHSS